MFNMLIHSNLPNVANAWKIWVDHIMKQKDTLGFTKAAMICKKNGMTQYATSGFILPTKEAMKFGEVLNDECSPEKISIKGKTFIVKSKGLDYLVAFNGAKYCIVCRSKTFYVVAVTETKSKLESAAQWLRRLTTKLVEKDF